MFTVTPLTVNVDGTVIPVNRVLPAPAAFLLLTTTGRSLAQSAEPKRTHWLALSLYHMLIISSPSRAA